MEIEKVAAETPETIIRGRLHRRPGYSRLPGAPLAFGLGIDRARPSSSASRCSTRCARVLHATWTLARRDQPADLTTKDGRVIALDAKVDFDDNALYRHPDVAADARHRRGGPARGRGRKSDLNYIKLDGEHRLHGQRRGPRHGDDGHHQAPRRHAGQLPRRRRRRDAGAGRRPRSASSWRTRTSRRSSSTSSAASCAATSRRRGRRRGGEGGGHSRFRSWSGSRARTCEEGRQILAARGLELDRRPRPGRRRRARSWRRSGGAS